MERMELASQKMSQIFGIRHSSIAETDPDFAMIRDCLIHGEIAWRGTLNDRTRELVTLAVLTTSQTLDELRPHVQAALNTGASPVEIKETLYQCAPYIGFPKTESALKIINEVFIQNGIVLPVESQRTVTEQSRFADGLRVQKSIFGDAIDQMHQSTPNNQKPIMRDYLSAFCFGDIYTRKGLNLKDRELLTFCIISTLGGCEAQVKAHVQGNLNVGNTKENLIDALAVCLPYLGFPRTLNALGCINAVIPEDESSR